jgi:acetyl-CoA carboxylase carboxyl transferase beta subunit/acetyl-CoA carboxylase carboxyl transferase alpha subunit
MSRLDPDWSTNLVAEQPPSQTRTHCPACKAPLLGRSHYERFRVCDECDHHFPIDLDRRIASLVDSGSFVELDRNLASTDPLLFADAEPYQQKLTQAQLEHGRGDAAAYGRAAIFGNQIALFALDFGFLGGSMGVVVGEKLARAAELARREKRALVTISASGGARMQEGLLSLLQMAKTASAVQEVKDAGLPVISILTHPTTGGVFASFASLGDVIYAEPKALIGFAGPRVAEQVMGRPLPPGSHTAEFLLAHGFVDAVISRSHLRSLCAMTLSTLGSNVERTRRARTLTGPLEPLQPWDAVQAVRDPDRPTAAYYIRECLDYFVELHGDRTGTDDPAVIAGLGQLDGQAVAVISFERGAERSRIDRRGGRPMPGGYRKAQRVMRLASRFQIPLIALIDTPGAWPGIESEEQGLAFEIATTMAAMIRINAPTVAVIIGEGGSGGALAFAVADRVLMQEWAIYSVIAPEGAAAILYRDASRAPELADRLKITAQEVRKLGISDGTIPEPAGGAKADPAEAARRVRGALLDHLAELIRTDGERRKSNRYRRYRSIGNAYLKESSPGANGSGR